VANAVNYNIIKVPEMFITAAPDWSGQSFHHAGALSDKDEV
jgi:hypothetical protein